MTLNEMRQILKRGGSCTALTIGTPYKEMKHGEAAEVVSVQNNTFTIVRSKTGEKMVVKESELSMFEYVYNVPK